MLHHHMELLELKSWPGTGTALPLTANHTTMLADQAATGVVHQKIATMVMVVAWWDRLDMDTRSVSFQVGKLATGSAPG